MTDREPTAKEILLSKMSEMERAEFRSFLSVDDAEAFVQGLTLQKILGAVEAERERCARIAHDAALYEGSSAESANEPEFSAFIHGEHLALRITGAIRTGGSEDD